MLNKDAVEVLLAAVNAKNPALETKLTKHNVSVSAVKTLDPAANSGMDAEVTITALPNGPFSGALTFQYARADITAAYGADINLDLTDMATVGTEFDTKIANAIGAESMPYAESLKVTVATASEAFTAFPVPAFSAEAAKSYIWKEGASVANIKCRILPPPAPQHSLYLKTKAFSQFPSDGSLGQMSYGNFRLAQHSMADGSLFVVDAKTQELDKFVLTHTGVNFINDHIIMRHLDTPRPFFTFGGSVYMFENDIAGRDLTVATLAADSAESVTVADIERFRIELIDADGNMHFLDPNSGKGIEFKPTSANYSAYTLTKDDGVDTIYQMIPSVQGSSAYVVTQNGNIAVIDLAAKHISLAVPAGPGSDTSGIQWSGCKYSNGKLYTIGKRSSDWTYRMGICDLANRTWEYFNLNTIIDADGLETAPDFCVRDDAVYIIGSNGSMSSTVYMLDGTNDLAVIKKEANVTDGLFRAFQTNANNESMVCMSYTSHNLLLVDFTESKELTGTAA